MDGDLTDSKTAPSPGGLQEVLGTLHYFLFIALFFCLIILGFSLNAKYMLGLVITAPVLIAMIRGTEKGRSSILYLICLTFVLGQRTIYLGEHVRVVPSEVLLWLLAALCLPLKTQHTFRDSIPIPVFLLFTATALGFFSQTFQESWNLDLSIAYSKGLWLATPAFFVCQRLLHRHDQIETIAILLALECLFLSFLDIAPIFHLPFTDSLSAYFGENTAYTAGAAGFTRTGAGFWGNPMLSAFVALCFPLILAQWHVSKSLTQKTLLGVSLVLSSLCIYFSGHRGIWLPWIVSLCCFYYLQGWNKILILLGLFALSVPFVPQAAKMRLSSSYSEQLDASTAQRMIRAAYAWELVKEKPILGNGWGASGLVHSDLLQLWADSGLPALAAFCALYFLVLRRLRRVLSKTQELLFKNYLSGFIASLLGFFLILTLQALFNLPEQYPAFWIMMAMAYQYPNIILTEQMNRAGQ